MFIVASVGGEACRLAGGGFGGGLRGACKFDSIVENLVPEPSKEKGKKCMRHGNVLLNCSQSSDLQARLRRLQMQSQNNVLAQPSILNCGRGRLRVWTIEHLQKNKKTTERNRLETPKKESVEDFAWMFFRRHSELRTTDRVSTVLTFPEDPLIT
ncbi:hypothetical protein GEV33_005946 [Tenebrio molitor]|uniref:Uncharacterized protein n=1 Tax=Tenebrio molitor TaxID=7067 RepID=A0A8J6LDL4_TENMO|nr:hypothetical protein GEV33_005946 [Tenebrio molitor]